MQKYQFLPFKIQKAIWEQFSLGDSKEELRRGVQEEGGGCLKTDG